MTIIIFVKHLNGKKIELFSILVRHLPYYEHEFSFIIQKAINHTTNVEGCVSTFCMYPALFAPAFTGYIRGILKGDY